MNQESLYEFVKQLNSSYVGPAMVFVLLGAGVFFTIRLRFVPLYFFRSLMLLIKTSDSKKEKASTESGMSPVQALATAIASQVGTGNIVGVAMAILMGGPGALFWMWISTLFGMSTNFAEAILGQLYKGKSRDGHIVGGPAFYIRDGLHKRWLADFFAVFFILALGMIGIMVQANSISTAFTNVIHISINPLWIGLGLALFCGAVLSGGITRIASFAESVVPLMAGVFVLFCLIFIFMHTDAIIPVFAEILKYAFTTDAEIGGATGIAVMSAARYGVSRGLFSNEAGLGTTPHAHAIAKAKQPYEQGMIAMLGIGVDLLICTLTGLVLLLSGVLDHDTSLVGIQIMQAAFHSSFGDWGNYFIALSLFFFAMSTIVGWYFFAAQNVRYLFGEKPIIAYRILVVVLIVLASIIEVPLIWELADTFNLFIVIPNVVAIIWLSPKVVKEAEKLRKAMKAKRRLEHMKH